jgi:hypothetical protein
MEILIIKKTLSKLNGIPQDSRRCITWSFTILLNLTHPLGLIIRMPFTTLEDFVSEKLKDN